MKWFKKNFNLTREHQTRPLTVIAGLTRNLLRVKDFLLAQEMADPCPP